jgi:Ca-activated chloride channel family protein
MIAEWSLARPWWLLALLPAGLLLWRAWRTPRAGTTLRQAVDRHLLPHLLVGAAPHRRGHALTACGLLLAVLALAGPVRQEGTTDVYRHDATRVLMVDLSTPMAAARLEAIRLKILALLRAVPEGQTALLLYAGEPYLAAPPTTDVDTLARFVPELAPDAMPLPGNRPEHAFAMAGGVLERSGSAVRDIVWINAASAGEARRFAMPPGVRLSILDAGANAALSDFAAVTGGAYVPMTADDADVREIAAALATGGGWRADVFRGARAAADYGPWLLLPLLPLAALAFRRGVLAALLVPLLAGLLAPPSAEAFEPPLPAALADARAWRRLQSGEDAAAAFRDPRWRAVAHYRAGRYEEAAAALAPLTDADALYNRGNALAMHGRLAEALTAYDAALELRPADGDARHNRDLVRRLLNPPPGAGNGPPPPAKARPPSPPRRTPADAEREAARLADQWLRQVPDEPATLLRRKLLAEHRRRLAGEAPRPW